MPKRNNFRTSVETITCAIIFASQALQFPVLAQGHFTAMPAPNVLSGPHVWSGPQIQTSPGPQHVWTGGGHTWSNTNSPIPASTIHIQSPTTHQHLFMHHHLNVGASNNPGTTSKAINATNQFAGTNNQLLIGGYHAGYIFHHNENTPGWTQQNSQNTAYISTHHLYGNTSSLFHHANTNTQTNYQHQNNLNNQTAITLSGSKSDNGSLLGSASLPSLFNLNLGSSAPVIQASNSLPVTITIGGYLSASGTIVGGRQMIVNPGQMLTAAQYTAMEQVVTSGQQTLVLSFHGTAISGLITLVAGQVSSLSAVEIPTHVLVDTVGFTSTNPLNVTGATQVLGSLYTLEQSTNVTAGLDSASLLVGSRGTVGDSLSNQSLFNTLFTSNGLTLSVLNNVTNQGTINSVGTLTISANQVANVSTANHQAVISAPDVNIYSASGTLKNSGQIIATSGNVLFNSASTQNININNTNGVIQALQGSIDVRDSNYAGNANINLTGGNWLSDNLNLNSGTGTVTANIGNVTGAINTNAGEAHISAQTQDLIIGNTNLSGDPTYYNALGAVTIDGNLNFSGQDLAIIANTNINTAAGAGQIDTSSATGNGGNITMIAGASLLPLGLSTSGSNDTGTPILIFGGSGTGGSINLAGSNPITSLTSASTHAGSSGGTITLAAFSGTGASSGTVTLPSSLTINSGGSGSGTNGNVTVIAGANSAGTGINIGNVNTSGGTGGNGNISLLTQTPVIQNSPMIIYNGSVLSGSVASSGTNTNSSIIAGNLTSGGGTITVTAGKSISTGSVTSNGVGTNGNGGHINLSAANVSSGNLQVNGNVSANGVGGGNGGTINLSYKDASNALLIGAAGANSYINGTINANAPNAGSGGAVTIANQAAANETIILYNSSSADISTTSGSGAAGNINFNVSNPSVDTITVSDSSSSTGGLSGILNGSALNISITVNNGNLTLGNLSTSGNSWNNYLNITDNANSGTITAVGTVTSAGTSTYTTGSNGAFIVNSGSTVSDTLNNVVGMTINSPTVTINGILGLSPSQAPIYINNNGANNALTVNFGSNGSIAGSLVEFNQAAPGAITIDSGLGTIRGATYYYGGTNGAVNVNVSNASSYLAVLYATGSSISITANQNELITAYGSGGNISSAGDVTLTGTQLILAGSIAGGTVNLNTGNGLVLTNYLNGNLSVSATSGNINIQSMSAGNALNVVLNSANQSNVTTNFTASGNINFNPNAAGSITISTPSSTPAGTFSANGGNGFVNLNIGTGTASVSVNSISGIVQDPNANFATPKAGNIFVEVASGQLTAGNFATSTGNFITMLNTGTHGTIVTHGNLQAGSTVTLTSGTAGSITVSAGNTVVGGTGVNLNAPVQNINGNLRAAGGNINLQSNGAANALTVNLGSASTLISVLGNIVFNSTAAPGAITMTSGFGSVSAGIGNIILNGGAGAVNINTALLGGLVIGGGPANLAGSLVNITVSDGLLQVGNLSSPGSISLTDTGTSISSRISISGTVSSTGSTVNLATSAQGAIQVVGGGPAVLAQNGINITTPQLLSNGLISTNTGDINIQSNGLNNALKVYMVLGPTIISGYQPTPTISALTGNVNFNPNNAGSVTIQTSYLLIPPTGTSAGAISANGGNGFVNLNIGTGTATIYANSISGIVQDPNANFGIPKAGNVFVEVASGQLTVGQFATSAGNSITMLNIGTNGTIVTHGRVLAGSTVNFTTGSNGSITVNSGNPVTGGAGVNFTSPQMNINAQVIAKTGNVNLFSNAINNALNINFLSNSGIVNAQSGNIVLNNSAAPGVITIDSGFGVLTASGGNGQIILNGGTGAVTINDNAITGIITGGGPAYLAGSSVNVTVANNFLQIGNLSSPGTITFINLNNSFLVGSVLVQGAVTSTGSTINITSGDQSAISVVTNGVSSINAATGINLTTSNLLNSGLISTNTGNINIQTNNPNNTLGLTLNANSSINAVTGNVNFNPNAAGSITMNTPSGTPTGAISANGGNGFVNLNIGTGTATIYANSISGIVQDPHANFASPKAGNVFVEVASGQLTAGNFATSTGHFINMLNIGNTGTVVTAGNLQSGSTATLTSGSAGSITVSAGNTVTADIDVDLNGPVQNINGVVTALNGNVNLQSNGTGNPLTVNMGPIVGTTPSQLVASSPTGNVTFNNTTSGAITITGGAPNGIISAGNEVIMNGGSGAVNSSNQEIIGCIHVNGSSISIQTWVGNLDFCVGINTSSTTGSGGNITLAANGGSVNSSSITTNGSGNGNSAGSVTITAGNGINIGPINSNGLSGASGGAVSISLPGQTITASYISATGSGNGNGGNITTNSGKLVLTGADSAGNSIDSNASGSGTGGLLSITTTAPQSFVVGNGAGTGNGVFGNISSNGTNGGFIQLNNNGPTGAPNLIVNGQITANGTTGSGGKVRLQGELPAGTAPLIVLFNGGLIQATNNANDSGRVGFNGGPNQIISLLGSGTINGGEFVHVGNLDPFTLDYLNPPSGPVTISPFLRITNNFSINGILFPPASTTNNTNLLVADLSKTDTDYTPWGHFYYENFEPRPRFQLGLAYKRGTLAFVPGTKSYGHIFVGAETDRLAKDGMKLISTNNPGYLNIDQGNILVSPDKNIVVGTHEGNIFVSPGAIAFVMESGHDVVIYNLRQVAPNQVTAAVGKHKLIVLPGHMMVLTRQDVKDFENIDADCHMVSYRNAQELPLNEKGVKAFDAQYSIASAFLAVEPLQQLIASNDHQDQVVFNKILKSAATLGGFSTTIDMQQLANLHRDQVEEETVLDSAKTMAASKGKQFQ